MCRRGLLLVCVQAGVCVCRVGFCVHPQQGAHVEPRRSMPGGRSPAHPRPGWQARPRPCCQLPSGGRAVLPEAGACGPRARPGPRSCLQASPFCQRGFQRCLFLQAQEILLPLETGAGTQPPALHQTLALAPGCSPGLPSFRPVWRWGNTSLAGIPRGPAPWLRAGRFSWGLAPPSPGCWGQQGKPSLPAPGALGYPPGSFDDAPSRGPGAGSVWQLHGSRMWADTSPHLQASSTNSPHAPEPLHPPDRGATPETCPDGTSERGAKAARPGAHQTRGATGLS